MLVTVPRLIESLRDHVERELEAAGSARNSTAIFVPAKASIF